MTAGELRKALEGVPDDYVVELEQASGVYTVNADGIERDDSAKAITIQHFTAFG